MSGLFGEPMHNFERLDRDTLNALLGEYALTKSLGVRDRIITGTMRMVIRAATQFITHHRPPYMDLDDAVAEAKLIAVETVDRFDGRRGFQYSTYLLSRVKLHLRKCLDTKYVRCPVTNYAVKEISRYRKAAATLRRSGDDSVAAVAMALGIPVEKAFTIRRAIRMRSTVSLHPKCAVARHDASESPGVASLRAAFDRLTDDERTIIGHDFGVFGYEKKKLQAAGEMVGISTSVAVVRRRRIMNNIRSKRWQL